MKTAENKSKMHHFSVIVNEIGNTLGEQIIF